MLRVRRWEESCDMLSSGRDMATILTSPLLLWVPAQHLLRIKPGSIPASMGEAQEASFLTGSPHIHAMKAELVGLTRLH